jgi:hypothetical protein
MAKPASFRRGPEVRYSVPARTVAGMAVVDHFLRGNGLGTVMVVGETGSGR